MRGKILLYQSKYRWQSLSILVVFMQNDIIQVSKIIYDTGVHQMRSFFTPYAVANSKKALQIITHLLRYAKNLIFYLNML